MNESPVGSDTLEITASIVSAFVSNNSVRTSELQTLIAAVHGALAKASEPKEEEPVVAAKLPAVPIKRSITDDYIICLDDGKRFKSLKRHLSSAYGMTPDEYRTKWGLGRDYPMVAPAYASARSSLARQMGLGRKREEAIADPSPDTGTAPAPEPRKRGRPRGSGKAAA